MTLHTPVVITDDDDVALAARSRKWPVVQRDGDVLHLTGVRQSIPLPEPSMRIEAGSLSGEHVAGWKLVLDWLEKHLHRPMMVVEPNGWAQDLALWSASSRGWPMGAWLHQNVPAASNAGAVALMNSATGVLFAHDEEERARSTQAWPTALSSLPDASLVDVLSPPTPSPSVRRKGITRVLLVAYSLDDSTDADGGRAESLLASLRTLSGDGLTIDLATTTHPSGSTDRTHCVPDLGPATLGAGRGPIETWATVAFMHAAEKPYAPTREVGGYWHVALERYFEKRDDHYDVVLITGDPVETFAFAAWAQDHWYARTVLDYGHPLTLPHRRGLAADAAAEAAYVERGWNMAADVVLVGDTASLGLAQSGGPEAVLKVCAFDAEDGEGGFTRELRCLIAELEPADSWAPVPLKLS